MAGSRREGSQDTIERSGYADGDHGDDLGDRRPEGGRRSAQGQAECLGEFGREGLRQAADASSGAAGTSEDSARAIAGCAQEITAAWARYAEEVMRRTSEANRALLRARTFNEMLEVQVKLLRDTTQAFLDQSVRVAELASRVATRPLEELKARTSARRQS